ncbi:unnamed protein product, partial [Phaeothamnion confervicola]
RATADLGDVGGELCRALRGLLDVAGDLVGRRTLLFDRRGNRGGDLRHPGNRAADLAHCRDRLKRRALDLGDLRCDLAGGFRGLSRQGLDLLGDHGEAAARVACTRSFDGGVQRQQVGLLGDRRDQLGDVADPLGGLRQFVDARVGALRLFHRLVGDAVGVLHLPADLVDRGGHFFRRRGDGLHVGRCFPRNGGDHRAQAAGGV